MSRGGGARAASAGEVAPVSAPRTNRWAARRTRRRVPGRPRDRPGATTQTAGLKREIMRAVLPLRVGTSTAAQGTVSSACSTTDAMASAAVAGSAPGSSRARRPIPPVAGATRWRRRCSPAWSPLPRGTSPSPTRPRASRNRYRRGWRWRRRSPRRASAAGSETIDSSICVAVMTGLPARLALAISSFWMRAISSMGTSTPRSPRATMMPSAASRMSSKCSSAPARSILAMMNGCRPSARAAARTASMSAAVSTNDWLTASTPCAGRRRDRRDRGP